MKTSLLSKVITFLFTDIQGSTLLWEEYADEMASALEKHDTLLQRIFESNNGHVFKTLGDGFAVAFASPVDALKASLESQRTLQKEDWGTTPIKVRMGLHTGEAEQRDNDYFGRPLNRSARLMSAGHGGQILISSATRDLLQGQMPSGISVKDMGKRSLKDLVRPENIFQVIADDLPTDFPPLKTLDGFRHNLLVQLTSFVGREKELSKVQQLLLENRLITLKGPGGVGKTRLSIQVAAEMLDTFVDGVWFIDLATITDPALILQTILNTIELNVEAGHVPLNVLIDFLQAKRSLLVFDNCEHLIDASAHLAEKLLQSSDKLKILATSRERIGIMGEVIFELQPLSTPGLDSSLSIDEVIQFEAIQLFTERAANALPDFSLSEENLGSLISICQRLDGIPLAIELAAAWVNILTGEQIAKRLDDSFRLLTSGSRTALPRQQTLYALIDWSYNLLGDSEKRLLNRLSTFAGGWDLEAAEGICSGSGIEKHEILGLLSQLVSKSLVVFNGERGLDARYNLLVTIQQYALEKLAETGEDEAITTQYLSYYQNLTDSAALHLRGGNQQYWFKKLSVEHDNLQYALEKCQSGRHFTEIGLRIAGNLAWFWYVRGYLKEGHYRLEKLLDFTHDIEDQAAHAKALFGISLLNAMMGNLPYAEEQIEKSLMIAEEIDHKEMIIDGYIAGGLIEYLKRHKSTSAFKNLEKALLLCKEINYSWGIGEAWHIMAHFYVLEGDLSKAASTFEKSIQAMRELGDEYSMSHPLNDLGRIVREQGNNQAALDLFEESRMISQKMGSKWGIALTLGDLGKIALEQKEFSAAIDYLTESVLLAHDLGDKIRIIGSLSFLGLAVEASGQVETFAKIQGAYDAFMEKHNISLSPGDEKSYKELFAAVREKIDDDTFNLWWNEGRLLSIEQAIQLVIQ